MKHIHWGFSLKGIGLGFSISKYMWQVDFLFWWIGGEF